MSIATIIARELRVLSRRPTAYGSRLAFVGLPFVIWCLMVWIEGPDNGRNILIAISLMATIVFGFGGAFAVADVISAERRERTLGLLLLTPLRPSAVLLGKFISSGMQFALCLLAVFPVIALPLLSGGVTWQEVARQCLNLVGLAFWGMAVGFFWSTVCREVKTSASLSFFTLLSLLILPAVTVFIMENMNPRPGPLLSPMLAVLAGPGLAFLFAMEPTFQTVTIWGYAANIGQAFGLGLLFLGMALIAFRIVWARERNPKAAPSKRRQASTAFQTASASTRRLRFGDWDNPYQQLTLARGRDSLFAKLFCGFLAGAFLFSVLSVTAFFHVFHYDLFLHVCVLMLLEVTVRWLVASEAPRQIHGDRESGMLELMLTTPIPSWVVVSGLRSALRQALRNKVQLLVSCHMLMFLLGTLTLGNAPPTRFVLLLLGFAITAFFELHWIQVVGIWWGLWWKSQLKVSVWLFMNFCLLPALILIIIFAILDAHPGWLIFWLCGRFLWVGVFAWRAGRKLRSLRQVAAKVSAGL